MNTNHEPQTWVRNDDSKSWREIAFDLQKQNINQRREIEQKDRIIEAMTHKLNTLKNTLQKDRILEAMTQQLDTLKNTLQGTNVKYQNEKFLRLLYEGLNAELKEERKKEFENGN